MSMASGTGIISGLDINGILSQMRQVGSRPINLIRQSQGRLETQKSALQGINKALLAFQEAADGLSDPNSFIKMSASSSDKGIVSVSADTTATAGNYSVKVQQLAQSHRIAGQGFETTDKTSVASASGSFSFKVGDGETQTVGLTAGMSLTDLRDKINAIDDSGMRASIINDGSDTNPYRLVLTSLSTGADNEITITQNDSLVNLSGNTIEAAAAESGNSYNGAITASGTYTGSEERKVVIEMTSAGAVGAAQFRVSLDGGLSWTEDVFTTSTTDQDITGALGEGINVKFTPDALPTDFAVGDRFTVDVFTPELQAAQDAMIEVDGVQVRRDANEFKDVIEGVTLTAKQVDADAQTVSVTEGNNNVQQRIGDFVKAYNDLVSTIDKATAYNVDDQSMAPLFGDSGVKTLQSTMRRLTTNFVEGLDGDITTLSSIGVTIGEGGLLKTDSAKLGAAVSDNLESVAALFAEAGNSTSSYIQFQKSSTATESGSYSVNITQAATQAAVNGNQVFGATDTLSQSEFLTISLGDEQTFISLDAGLTLDQAIDRINTHFADNSMQMAASNEGGQLRIAANEYGSKTTITVRSNRADAAGSLGLGTVDIESTGLDVEGTINGVGATGDGQNLNGLSGSAAEGLQLKITATGPLSGTIDVSRGLAQGIFDEIENLTDSETGLFAVRSQSYETQMERFTERIDAINMRLDAEQERMREQFVGLETKLAEMQSQGDFLNRQLASLI